MSYLDHIRACNAHDLSGFRAFLADGGRIGWIRHSLAGRLAAFEDIFEVGPDLVTFRDHVTGFDERSAAMARTVGILVNEGQIPELRREDYGVASHWGAPALFRLDRAAVPFFGVRSYGLHVNGFVRKPDGLHIWVGKRATDRKIAPGKLDNLIAGGQPYGLSLAENLVKEAGEEAGLSPETAARAKPVGIISYLMENRSGLKPDTLFVYDLELPEDFVPRNTDGEVEEFRLWPVERVAETVKNTDDFKFNVNLVIIDFLIRHGLLGPDDPDYLPLAHGLRRNLP